jgi:hypothetical protein
LTLALTILAAVAAPPVQASVRAQASGQIIQGARVVAGRSDLPARTGITLVKAEDGRPQLLRLVEFN